jgi:hypothetical protein
MVSFGQEDLTVGSAASAGACSTEPPSLRWLRALNALIKTTSAIAAWSVLGIFLLFSPPLFMVALFIFIFCLCLTTVASAIYLTVLFLCHTRYSLRTMMAAVLALGLGLTLLVSGYAVLMVAGALMLYALAMEILFALLQSDPLRSATPLSPGFPIKKT